MISQTMTMSMFQIRSIYIPLKRNIQHLSGFHLNIHPKLHNESTGLMGRYYRTFKRNNSLCQK